MKLIRPAALLVLILTVAVTVAIYHLMPDVVASHWNAAGEMNGTMPKFWGLLLVPALMGFFSALFLLLPRIDPLRENYRKFQDYYDGFILVFVVFFLVIQLQIILWGLGVPVSPNIVLPFMIGILFIYIGFMLEHAEPNWFVGIRTPWTMSSKSVWKETHRVSAKLFKIAGVVCMTGIFAGTWAWLFILVPVMGVAVFSVVYSYVVFRKEQAAGIRG